jgi:hypothetical protein
MAMPKQQRPSSNKQKIYLMILTPIDIGWGFLCVMVFLMLTSRIKTSHMHQIKSTILLLLLTSLGLAAQAQPAEGQMYLTLRSHNFGFRNTQDNSALTPVSTINTGFNLHLQAGKMLSNNRSVGFGLMGGFNRRAVGLITQSNTIGASVFVRQWFEIVEKFSLHLDLQASSSYTGGFSSDKVFRADLGLLPGISWFFHPKWSLEGRMAGLNLHYLSETTFFTESRGLSLVHDVNPLAMQFAISRFF